MGADYFGESVAARYDEDDAGMFAPEVIAPTVDFLAALATDGAPESGSALELGIGTGRIALPLSERGVLVHGIDLSAAMVARLRAKPGADRVTATMGDFATATAGTAPPSPATAASTSPSGKSQPDAEYVVTETAWDADARAPMAG